MIANNNGGCWIGIDIGTTNCAVAVYDRTRGSSKWIRLRNIASYDGSKNKIGRIIPSVIIVATQQYINEVAMKGNDHNYWIDISHLLTTQQHCNNKLYASVGAAAIQFINNPPNTIGPDENNNTRTSSDRIEAATLRNFKRKILSLSKNVNNNSDDTVSNNNPLSIPIKPLGMADTINISAIDATTVLLYAIRLEADDYLSKNISKKSLQIPGDNTTCLHCTIGVPTASTHYYRQSAIIYAASRAGFTGTVTTLSESTAAAMSYGLFAQQSSLSETETINNKPAQTILIFDMGGGTTDVTIAQQQQQQQQQENDDSNVLNSDFRVVATAGNNALGGVDVDVTLVDLVHQKVDSNEYNILSTIDYLLEQCKNAKEVLSGNNNDPPATETSISVTVQHKNKQTDIISKLQITITQQDFRTAIQPIVQKAENVVLQAIQSYAQNVVLQKEENPQVIVVTIHEVVLVGGASRVPAIREMLRTHQQQSAKPPTTIPVLPISDTTQEDNNARDIPNLSFAFEHDLCVSINPMSAVAQGCAIQAALLSHTIPYHEIRSALMLDTCPYPIGVFVQEDSYRDNETDHLGHFVEVISKGSTLPAANYATFQLGDINQPGVTIKVVEKISDDNYFNNNNDGNNNATRPKYNDMGTFTFLLHRLSTSQKEALDGNRSIDVGMTLTENGEFIVSIFDQHDPDHLRKRANYIKAKRSNDNNSKQHSNDSLSYNKSQTNDDPVAVDDPITIEQILLFVVCIVIFIFYLVIKIALNENEDASYTVEEYPIGNGEDRNTEL